MSINYFVNLKTLLLNPVILKMSNKNQRYLEFKYTKDNLEIAYRNYLEELKNRIYVTKKDEVWEELNF